MSSTVGRVHPWVHAVDWLVHTGHVGLRTDVLHLAMANGSSSSDYLFDCIWPCRLGHQNCSHYQSEQWSRLLALY